MPTTVRSYSKINLGLAIGPPRADGFHSLCTLYQTLALHDLITVSAQRAETTKITLTSNHPRVPVDGRNTVWKMVERTLETIGVTAEVEVHIQKNLPIQGGMGAGSANAAAALIGLEQELGREESTGSQHIAQRFVIAAEVGSDVPLFLIGGSVLGHDRGQLVGPVPDLVLGDSTQIPCVVVLPPRGVSTPQAFRDWDARLQQSPQDVTIEKLSRTYASVFGLQREKDGTAPIFPDPESEWFPIKEPRFSPEKLQRLSSEQHHQPPTEGKSDSEVDLSAASETLSALVAAGLENDFEQVVFLQYPLLRELKQLLQGAPEASDRAVYAALSGSGSALFGLYRSQADAVAAQQRLQKHGVVAIVTTTLPRPLYWSNMFAEVTGSGLQ